MRALFSLVALVGVLVIVLLLVQRQMSATRVPSLAAPGVSSPAPASTKQSVQQQLDQLRHDLDAATQQRARAVDAAEAE
jgi:hypothetical protein